jgi:hypothetical protein
MPSIFRLAITSLVSKGQRISTHKRTTAIQLAALAIKVGHATIMQAEGEFSSLQSCPGLNRQHTQKIVRQMIDTVMLNHLFPQIASDLSAITRV